MEDFYTKHYSQLVGGKITQILVDDSDFEPVYGLVVETPDGKTKAVWVLCDEEGNGAGFLDIEFLD